MKEDEETADRSIIDSLDELHDEVDDQTANLDLSGQATPLLSSIWAENNCLSKQEKTSLIH